MRKTLFSLVLTLITACSVTDPAVSPQPTQASDPCQADSGTVMIYCGSLIDGRSDQVLNDVSVLIEAGRFSRIATRIETPPGVEVLDLVAVKGNPLDDISILEDIEVVVKGGLVFKATGVPFSATWIPDATSSIGNDGGSCP